eukprot:CAMPEP_0197321922 /NCGR_PEP_ID=MMETSP0891-20130614/67035_1 /TAXON_ID=44058 ORGANISM="Aureoumbra lagunensis, Strain CCMP1510" /NCGR_SAMPLE_ID=MMETSP0891 /ASSEMBLY_ACC=CAM_ASM_000534 /LENGTH=799 /DNA_ID=CAMNT_0042814033 /DNA_START=187 /DNA_END=2586 /DNA_ORIENTATION=+
MRKRHSEKWRPCLDALTELQQAAEITLRYDLKYESHFAHSENYAKILRDATNKFHDMYSKEHDIPCSYSSNDSKRISSPSRDSSSQLEAVIENHLFNNLSQDTILREHLISFLTARKDSANLKNLRWWQKLRQRLNPLCDRILLLLSNKKSSSTNHINKQNENNIFDGSTQPFCVRQVRAELRGAAHKLRLRPPEGIEQKQIKALTALLRREKNAFDFATAIKHYRDTFNLVSSALESTIKQNVWPDFCNSLFYGEYCLLKVDVSISVAARLDNACKKAIELAGSLPWNPLFLYNTCKDTLEHLGVPFGPDSISNLCAIDEEIFTKGERILICVDSGSYFEHFEDEDDMMSMSTNSHKNNNKNIDLFQNEDGLVDGEVSPTLTATTVRSEDEKRLNNHDESYISVLSDDGQELRRLSMIPGERLASAILTAASGTELPELVSNLLCGAAVKVLDATHAKKIAAIADALPSSQRRHVATCRFGLKPEPDGCFVFAPIALHSTLVPESLWRNGEILAPSAASRKLTRRAKAAKIKSLKALDGVAGDTEYRQPLVHRDAYSDDDQDFELSLGEQEPLSTPVRENWAASVPLRESSDESSFVQETKSSMMSERNEEFKDGDEAYWDQVCKRLARKPSFATSRTLNHTPHESFANICSEGNDIFLSHKPPIITALHKFLDDIFYLPLRRFGHKHEDPTLRVAMFRLDQYLRDESISDAPPLFHARLIASTRFADALLDHCFGPFVPPQEIHNGDKSPSRSGSLIDSRAPSARGSGEYNAQMFYSDEDNSSSCATPPEGGGTSPS